MKKALALSLIVIFLSPAFTAITFADEPEDILEEIEAIEIDENFENLDHPTYLKAVINTEQNTEIQKSTTFSASQSFIPYPEREIHYEWDFGDGNKNEGIEVVHAYKEPGQYTTTLTLTDGIDTAESKFDVFAYKRLIVLITDQVDDKEEILRIQNYDARNESIHVEVIESFGSSTEFISEEILTKKLTENAGSIQKSSQIIIWTKENAGLNALSRYIKSNEKKSSTLLSQKTIVVINDNISANKNRIQRQFELLAPKNIVIVKKASIYSLIESNTDEEFFQILTEGGFEHEIVTAKTGKIRPWNFMSYLVNLLTNQGIPDNTIALLLLLPVIATVIAFMKQVVGMTTFGIYTPSIITLSFLVIGIYAGILTLTAAILIGTFTRPVLKKLRMLYIPKMAIVITLVSLTLFLILIVSIYLNLFDAQFLSIAIFPMLILSTLVEKFISVKTDKGLSSATVLMIETVIVAIIAYIIAGGEISLGITTIKFEFVRRVMLTYPEIIFLLLITNILLGKWSGLRLLEYVRFREVLRHIEE